MARVTLTVAPRFARLVRDLEPYVVAAPAALAALDLAPFGVAVTEARRSDATRRAGAAFVARLERLDAATFGAGDGALAMPRWVLFDCGAVPGLVFGFGAAARGLPPEVRAHFGVDDDPDAFVPLSMWIAIRAVEEGAWFGHNLASANVLCARPRWPGLATLTKVLGVRVARATAQLGATQWMSPSLGIHLQLGELELLAADVPAHTIRESLVYRVEPTEAGLAWALEAADARGAVRPPTDGDLLLSRGDVAGLRAVHDALEVGERWWLVGLERPGEGSYDHVRLRRRARDAGA